MFESIRKSVAQTALIITFSHSYAAQRCLQHARFISLNPLKLISTQLQSTRRRNNNDETIIIIMKTALLQLELLTNWTNIIADFPGRTSVVLIRRIVALYDNKRARVQVKVAAYGRRGRK